MIFLAIFIPLLLLVILPKVAQAMINGSTMNIIQMNMTNPQETSVQVSVQAAIEGIPSLFAATVEFLEPAQVFWVREGSGGQTPKVGQMSLGVIEKKAFAKAEFTQATTFQIADPVLFGEFAKVMVSLCSSLYMSKKQHGIASLKFKAKGEFKENTSFCANEVTVECERIREFPQCSQQHNISAFYVSYG